MKIHHFILKGFEHLKKERLFKINFEVKTVNFRCCLNENRTMGATWRKFTETAEVRVKLADGAKKKQALQSFRFTFVFDDLNEE